MPAMMALALACVGSGSTTKPDHKTFSGSADGTYGYGGRPFSASFDGTVDGTREQQFADQVDVELTGSEGRIRLPRIVLPIVHGGDAGWFELKNLKITDRDIEGEARINIINRPKVHIDRVTGTISINGKAGNYIGRCEAVESAAERKF